MGRKIYLWIRIWRRNLQYWW